MIRTIFQGMILGLMIAVSVGPAFLAIIQTGMSRGFKSSFFMALGISASDIVLITICYLGASTFFDEMSNKLFVGIIGGIILIGYGIYSFFKKPEDHPKKIVKKKKKRTLLDKLSSPDAGILTYIIKGFFMNLLNPFLLVFWLTAMGWVSANAEEGKLLNYAIAFFGGTLGTVFATDLLKSLIGTKISRYLKPRNILWINRIVGIALASFGVFLMIKVLVDFT